MVEPQRRFLALASFTAVALLGASWILSAFFPMAFMTPEYAMWRARKDIIETCALAPVIVQGDSRAAAGLLPARLGRSGDVVNLALGGATPVEIYYATQAILKCGQAPRQVVMSLSPGLFMTPVHFWERAALFQFLDFAQLEEIRKASREFGEAIYFDPPTAGDVDAILGDALHAVSFPSYYLSSMTDHLLIGRLSANRTVRTETRRAGGQHAYGTEDGSDHVADEGDLHVFRPSAMLNGYMERLLNAYAAVGTQVVFVPVPLNQATFEHLHPGVASEFQAYLEHLAATHRNFRLAGPAMEALDNRYFGDMTHLNAQGAQVFSAQVDALLASGSRAD